MRELILKEFRWNWRSFRYPALFLVLLFFALLAPPSNKYMREIIAMFAEGIDPSLLPEPSAVDSFIGYLGDISGIGILVLIFILMGSVAREKENGVSGWILSKPVSRWSYLNAKIMVHLVVVIMAVVLANTVGYLYTWSLLGQVPLAGAAWATVSLLIFMLLFAVITFAFSAVLKSPLQAGGVSVLVFFLSGILNMFVGELQIGRFYPNTLLAELPKLVTGASGPGEILPTILFSILIGIAVYILTGIKFMRMEQ